VNVGDSLPEVAVDVTATLIVSAALASRDFEPVHHDRAAANAAGMPDIFINILASNGLVVKYVTDWAGPEAIVRRSSIRLGVPHLARETLRITGEVAAVRDGGDVDVDVRGRNTMGDHVSGTVTVNLP
jgi:acyl dehydratase